MSARAHATGDYSIAIGSDSTDTDLVGATAAGESAVAIGREANAGGAESLSVGADSAATGLRTTAFGYGATATGLQTTAAGTGSIAEGIGTLAFGSFATARGNYAMALGYASYAPGFQATAVGNGAQASGDNASALGRRALARAESATALGHTATADYNRSTAIGYAAVTTASDQVVLGGTGSSVKIGDLDASTAAQQGPVDVVTVDADGVLGRQQAATAASVNAVRADVGYLAAVSDAQFQALSDDVLALGGRIDAVEFRLDEMDQGFSGGIAASMALGSAMVVPDKNLSVSLNAATYGGEQGFSGMLTGRVSDSVYVSAGVAGNTGDDKVGGQVGVAFGF